MTEGSAVREEAWGLYRQEMRDGQGEPRGAPLFKKGLERVDEERQAEVNDKEMPES